MLRSGQITPQSFVRQHWAIATLALFATHSRLLLPLYKTTVLHEPVRY